MWKSRHRFVLIVTYVFIFLAIFLYARSTPAKAVLRPGAVRQTPSLSPSQDSRTGKELDPTKTGDSSCHADPNRLRKLKEQYELTSTFQYAKRLVRFVRQSDVQRTSMTEVAQRLLHKDFQSIPNRPQASLNRAPCPEPINVLVSASGLPKTVNASELMFGVSTTYPRLMESSTTILNDWSFWLTDGYGRSNGGKLILMLVDAQEEDLQNAQRLLREAGIDADTFTSDASLPMAARNLALVPTMYRHPDSKTKKWLALCDDDTFFPNMHALIDKLHSFDARSDMYVGGLSEDGFAVEKHGRQAFGGAGVFLSRPAAEKIAQHFDECSSEETVAAADWQGDRLLRQCVSEHSHIELTALPDLWQLDMFDDPSGFYEWGIKPLSIHHYRSWHKANPSHLTRLARICGEDCTGQRFHTADDFIISGYSIAQYPEGIDFNTSQVERTFKSEKDMGTNFDDKMGTQRASLHKTGKKLAWALVEARLQDDGTVLQTYVGRANDTRWVTAQGRPLREQDSVIELVWMPSPGTSSID